MSIVKNIIQPISQSSEKIVVQLPANRNILPNLKLLNVHVSGSGVNASVRFPSSSGAWSLFRRITLFNGNEMIDTIRDVPKWMSFKNLLAENVQQKNMMSQKIGSNLNYEVVDKARQSGITKPFNKGVVVTCADVNDFIFNLNDVLSYLNSETILRYPDLRVEFELETDPTKVFVNYTADFALSNMYLVYSESDFALDKIELINDEKVKSKLMQRYMPQKVLEFISVESDRFNIPAVTAGTQATNIKILGFNGKTLYRVVLAVEGLTSNLYSNSLKSNNSTTQVKEVLNFYVNGSKLLPLKGIDNPQLKLALCTGAWGDLLVPSCFNIPLLQGASKVYATNLVTDELNKLDYYSFYVNSPITDLQIEYSRDHNIDSKYNQPLNVYIFGEVGKARMMDKNGDVVLSYL